MAVLFEGYTLCGLVPPHNASRLPVQGVEEGRDSDHVVVTDSTRTVTVYKVSDQKPLGSWTVKQGQILTCSAVYNSHTKEYVAVSDSKVIRIWKEDILLDKAFKATVSSDIWKVHCAPGAEPVVLFQRGAVRLLDKLLSAPQQHIEVVLAQDEVIRWSTSIVAKTQQCVIFTTEQKGDYFLYLQRPIHNTLQRYRLEEEEDGLAPLSFSASYRDRNIYLLYMYPNGHVYQSAVSVRDVQADEGVQSLPLPRNLLLALNIGEDLLGAAAAQVLDEAHIAVVGVPHPSAQAGKDFLCIWNTNFQTVQAGKEMAGKMYGQLWMYSNKLFIPHGKTLSVIPYECSKSSLASALGKLRQARTKEPKVPLTVPSWSNILHGENLQPSRTVESRKTRITRRTQSVASVTLDQVLDLSKAAPVDEVLKAVEHFLSKTDLQDLQSSVGQLASVLVSRSLADPGFYASRALAQLVCSQCLCHSVCPELMPLALERNDYYLCQLCLQFFPDIPEAVTCTCLKAFISLSDDSAAMVTLDPDSVSFMETLMERRSGQDGMQNGFSPTSCQDDCSNDLSRKTSAKDTNMSSAQPNLLCPVGLHKAVLLNEVLQTAFSNTFLLPQLKDLTTQQVMLFLQYLQFLFRKYFEADFPELHGLRSPTLNQIMDWVCLLLDANFTVLVMTPEAKALLLNLHKFVASQVRVYSELGKLESSLKELHKMKTKRDINKYSIEVIELF
ncbi:nucleolar protein 11-like [Thalassophryne amazonica]|uniref:nucleolar protein 11-like n=1 Tax=Thalassophryne amazonica TaxID=390379 RepID=UPI001470A6F3|nr:nucleolar protein 11-like [Thalassophryne amazonica]